MIPDRLRSLPQNVTDAVNAVRESPGQVAAKAGELVFSAALVTSLSIAAVKTAEAAADNFSSWQDAKKERTTLPGYARGGVGTINEVVADLDAAIAALGSPAYWTETNSDGQVTNYSSQFPNPDAARNSLSAAARRFPQDSTVYQSITQASTSLPEGSELRLYNNELVTDASLDANETEIQRITVNQVKPLSSSPEVARGRELKDKHHKDRKDFWALSIATAVEGGALTFAGVRRHRAGRKEYNVRQQRQVYAHNGNR